VYFKFQKVVVALCILNFEKWFVSSGFFAASGGLILKTVLVESEESYSD
jgi:hypothetical protein